MAPFLWIGFNCLKATELVEENSLLLTMEPFKTCPGRKSLDIIFHIQH